MSPAPEGSDRDLVRYREGLDEGVVRIQYCPRCDQHRWPPRPVCSACGGDPEWVDAPRTGRIRSWTVVGRSTLPEYADAVPYVVAVVDVGDTGIRMIGRVDRSEGIDLADRVVTWSVVDSPRGPRVVWMLDDPDMEGRS
jgi:uncharacterized OB-fold protein